MFGQSGGSTIVRAQMRVVTAPEYTGEVSSRRAEGPGPVKLTNRPIGTVATPGSMRRWPPWLRPTDPPHVTARSAGQFRATGAAWLGAFRPPDLAKSTENGTRQWAKDVATAIANRAQDPDEEAPDGSPIQDPSPATPNLPAADTANSAQSHLMVEQEIWRRIASSTCWPR